MSNGPKDIDGKDGKWYVCLSEFRFPHGTRSGVVFDSRIPTRVLPDAWIESQHPMIQEVADPFGAIPESPVVQESPLRDTETGKPATGVGTGPQGTGTADEVRAKKKS